MNLVLKFSLILLFLSLGTSQVQAQKSETEQKLSESVEVSEKEPKLDELGSKLFKNYAWLKDQVDPQNCTGYTITELTDKVRNINYLMIDDGSGPKMYDASGKYYCAPYEGFSCIEFYKLEESEEVWRCKP